MTDRAARRPRSRRAGERGRLSSLAAWGAAVAVYGGAQAVSSWLALSAGGDSTRPQYDRFEQPAFAPPGELFPVVWSGLNLTTASSAWRLWRVPAGRRARAGLAGARSAGTYVADTDGRGTGAAGRYVADADLAGSGLTGSELTSARRAALAWWAAGVVLRTGYVPLAFGRRQLWAATVDSALLCAVMARYASLARRVDGPAAALAVPEIAWTAFATALSAAVARKNAGNADRRHGSRAITFGRAA